MIAICIGHSRPGDRGAVSTNGTTEHAFNSEVGRHLIAELQSHGQPCVMIDRYNGDTYRTAQRWLASHLKSIDATLALELHFNATDGRAKGHEYLHWHDSKKGHRLAYILQHAHLDEWPETTSRGIKPLTRVSRGGLFCRLPHCPSVICEPFFGDNPAEWAVYGNQPKRLASTYCQGLLRYLSVA